MAISQPLETDKLNSPDHSALHRIIAADTSAAVKSIAVDSNGNVGIGTTSPTAYLHLKAGTADANTAPVKFTSGVLNSTAEAGAVEFLTDKYYATITTGATRKEIQLYDTYYAEVYIYENTTSTGIATQNIYHAIGGTGIGTAGAIAGFTLASGINGSIASVADYSGTEAGTIKITVTAGHNLTTGDIITISGTTDYNGTFSITSISSTEFYITEIYTSSQTGIYIRGARLKANTGSAGTYRLSFNLTGFSAGANKTFKVEANKNLTSLDNIASSRKFTSSTDYSQMSGNGLITLADGDIVWLSIMNQTDATDFTVRHLNANISRI